MERHDRDSYTLASKLPAFLIASEAQVESIFEEQLKKCGVEYFDYFLLHNLNKILYNGIDGKGGTVKSCHMFEHIHVMLHGIPAFDFIHTYNSCQLQPNPTFAAELNYLKGQLAKSGWTVKDKLPEEKVLLEDGTDVTEEVTKAEKWLMENSF